MCPTEDFLVGVIIIKMNCDLFLIILLDIALEALFQYFFPVIVGYTRSICNKTNMAY